VALYKVMIVSFIEFGLITVLMILIINIGTSQCILLYVIINYKLICVKSIFFYIQIKRNYIIEITYYVNLKYILQNLTALTNIDFHVKLLV